MADQVGEEGEQQMRLVAHVAAQRAAGARLEALELAAQCGGLVRPMTRTGAR